MYGKIVPIRKWRQGSITLAYLFYWLGSALVVFCVAVAVLHNSVLPAPLEREHLTALCVAAALAVLSFLIAELCDSKSGGRISKPVTPMERLANPSAPVDCLEHRRLISEHRKAIAEWRRTFDSAGAWKKALQAEEAIQLHLREHGCQATSSRPGHDPEVAER